MKPALLRGIVNVLVFMTAIFLATAQYSLTVTSGAYLKAESRASFYTDSLILKLLAPYVQRVYYLVATLPAFTSDLTISYRDSEFAGFTAGSLSSQQHQQMSITITRFL